MRRSRYAAALAIALVAPAAGAVPTRFLVAEFPGAVVHGDSYVLVLEADADIAQARALILDPDAPGGHIASAQIAPGADGVNRDHRAPGEPPWSWHVTEFEGFFESTIELCDGWPTFVEEDVAGWIANTGGAICFWQYTVVEELPEPGAALRLAAGAAVLASAARLRRARRPGDKLSTCASSGGSRSA